ncbi:unnamed protein product [Clonostachys byssicola]|uniref:Uncharacterized protein n=1 Tax=Clonostachys byssicola TaxID=160290 RepID=A0A9N9Y1Y2_9HYPO|nr:unnamed protein product [Clonostachys byssicola]
MELLIYFSNRPSGEPPLTLDTIPVEILHHICTFFCDHCDPMKNSQIENSTNHNPNEGKKDLLNLCLTSRALCGVAQGVLFHHFSFGRHLNHGGPVAFRLAASSFLQALSNKPHLRVVVKELKIKTKRDTLYPRLFGFRSLTEADQHSAELVRTLGAETGMQFRYDELQPSDLREAMIQLMIAACPNISKVQIQIPRYWTFNKLVGRNYTKSSTNRQPLSSLQTLDALVERLPTDDCEFPHQLCNLPAFVSLSERALVAGSASRLETLKCTLGALENAPDMPRLEVLKLDVRGSFSGDLKALFAKMPKLRELTYCSSNKHGPLPIEVNAALRDHRETLEVLAIHFWKADYEDLVILDPTIDNTEFRLGLVNDFTNLKALIRIREASEKVSQEESFQSISDTLPESLEMLCVHAPDMVSKPDYAPLMEVADRVREGRFKSLKHVLWTRKQSRSYPSGLGWLNPQDDKRKSGVYFIGGVEPETAVDLRKRYPILTTMLNYYYV